MPHSPLASSHPALRAGAVAAAIALASCGASIESDIRMRFAEKYDKPLCYSFGQPFPIVASPVAFSEREQWLKALLDAEVVAARPLPRRPGNLDDALRRTVGNPSKQKRFLDVNPGFGGPIKRDKLWFFTAYKNMTSESYAAGVYSNKNAGNPNAWTYDPDVSREAAGNDYTIKNSNTRLTWQATSKLKLAFMTDLSSNCDCPRALTAARSPEAAANNYITIYPKRQIAGDFTAPLTSRYLLEGGIYNHHSFTARPRQNPFFSTTSPKLMSRWISQLEAPRIAGRVTTKPGYSRVVPASRISILPGRNVSPSSCLIAQMDCSMPSKLRRE